MQMRICQHPKHAVFIFSHINRHVACKRFFIKGIVKEFFKLITVVPVQAIMCGNPQKTFAVLVRCINDVVGEPLFNSTTGKRILLCNCSSPPDNHRDKEACKKKSLSLHTLNLIRNQVIVLWLGRGTTRITVLPSVFNISKFPFRLLILCLILVIPLLKARTFFSSKPDPLS